MTTEEALDLALEALQFKNILNACGQYFVVDPAKAAEAITAIKQARSAPVQEPVAWRFDQAKYRENDLRGRQWAFNVFSQTKPYMDEMVRNLTPLYTTPPAAQRQCEGCDKIAKP
jgi:hypothetical protein